MWHMPVVLCSRIVVWLVSYLCACVLCEAYLLSCVSWLLLGWLHIFMRVFCVKHVCCLVYPDCCLVGCISLCMCFVWHMLVVLCNRIVVWLVAYLCACVLCEACLLSFVTRLLFGWLHIFVHVFCVKHVYCLV